MAGITGERPGRRSHAQRNHERLVAAAREVFAERGIDASLEEIARRAGVGIGTLYRHFTTREALVEALVERRIGDLVAAAAAAAEEPDGWAALTGLLERTLELQAADRVLKEVVMRHPLREGHLAGARARLRDSFEQVLERARADGALRPDFAVSDLVLLLWSFAPVIDATASIAPEAWRRHLHLVLDGLRPAAATPAPAPPLRPEQLEGAMATLRRAR